jgi:bacterioferritin-associated ferredoxin
LAKTIVCHCEDISLDELYSALEQGYNGIESIKRFTGIGTGKCQGKCCIVQTVRELDGDRGRAAIALGRNEGPGSPSPDGPTDPGDSGKLPTIRQPVMPLKIDDIRGPADPAGESKNRSEDS